MPTRDPLPARRRLRHRLDQHPPAAGLRHLRRLRRAGPGDRLSPGARNTPSRRRWTTRPRRGAGCCSRALLRSRLAIAGDSAGGGLTFATLVNLRDQKLGLPACAVAISPWVDLEGLGNSITARAAQDPMVQKDGLLWMAGMYLGGKDAKTPLAAPLHADLKGLPPILVQVGTAETLLDDATRIAEKLHAAGVDVRLAIWPNMLHVFPLFAPSCRKGATAASRSAAFIRSKTGLITSYEPPRMMGEAWWRRYQLRQPLPQPGCRTAARAGRRSGRRCPTDFPAAIAPAAVVPAPLPQRCASRRCASRHCANRRCASRHCPTRRAWSRGRPRRRARTFHGLLPGLGDRSADGLEAGGDGLGSHSARR